MSATETCEEALNNLNEEVPVTPTSVVSPSIPDWRKPIKAAKKRAMTPHARTTATALDFKHLRKQIFRDVHLDVMKGGKFADEELSLYTRRTKQGTPYRPQGLAFNKRLLSAASSEFEKHLFGDEASITSDGYTGDSDLEEDGEVESGSGGESASSDSSSLSRATVSTLDFDTLSDKDDDEVHKAPSRPSNREQRTLHYGAFRTWQAMILYLYDFDDNVSFKPLRSSSSAATSGSNTTAETWACSPKSMYRLAHKFQLLDLKNRAKKVIEEHLTADNIVPELFSDLTWRYPDILQMEMEVFHDHSHTTTVDRALKESFDRIAAGELPHCSIVMQSLFTLLITKNKASLAAPRTPDPATPTPLPASLDWGAASTLVLATESPPDPAPAVGWRSTAKKSGWRAATSIFGTESPPDQVPAGGLEWGAAKNQAVKKRLR